MTKALAGLGFVLLVTIGAMLVAWVAVFLRLWTRWFGLLDPDAARRRTRTVQPLVGDAHVAETCDGVRIPYRHLPGTHPAVIIVGGGYRLAISEFMPLIRDVHRAGFHVVAFDWRGCGECERPAYPSLGVEEQRDVVAVVEDVRRRMPGLAIGMLGISLGASMAMVAASKYPDVQALWLDGPYLDPRSVLENSVRRRTQLPGVLWVPAVGALLRWRRGIDLDSLRFDTLAREIRAISVRIVVAGRDGLVPFTSTAPICRAAGWGDHIWVVPDAPHGSAYRLDPDRYVREACRFFVEALGVTRGARLPAVLPEAMADGALA